MPDLSILYPGMVGNVAMSPTTALAGKTQAAPLVTPILPGVAFTALGVGEFAVSNLTMRQGAVDVYFLTGAAGSNRALVALIDKVNGRIMQLFLDTNNKVNLLHQDAGGTTKAAVTAQLAAEGTGASLRYRYSWDSTQAIDSTRFAILRKNEDKVTTWGTDPTAAFSAFVPTHVYVGCLPAGIGTGSDFNGTIQKVQIGTKVVTA